MLTDQELKDLEASLRAQAEFIKAMRALADEAEGAADVDDRRVVSSLRFQASFAAFSTFWLPSVGSQEFVQARWPDLPRFDARDFEVLVQELLTVVDGDAYALTPASHDQGIDLRFTECVDPNWDAYATTYVQCKLYRGSVPVSEVRDFFGVMAAHTARGLFVTTGSLTAQGSAFVPTANGSPHANRLHVLAGEHLRKALSAVDELAHAIVDSSREDEVPALRRRAGALTWRALDVQPAQQRLL